MTAKILLADDSNVAQRMGREILAAEGFEVLTVSNGHAAVKKLNDGLPDLILADVFMPGNTGYELCEIIKSDRKLDHIPVVLLVGAMEPYDPEEGRRVKADGVITKPLQSSTLVSIVKNLLGSNQKTEPAKPAAKLEPSAGRKEPPLQAEERPIAKQETAATAETFEEVPQEVETFASTPEPNHEATAEMTADEPIAAFEELVHPENHASEEPSGYEEPIDLIEAAIEIPVLKQVASVEEPETEESFHSELHAEPSAEEPEHFPIAAIETQTEEASDTAEVASFPIEPRFYFDENATSEPHSDSFPAMAALPSEPGHDSEESSPAFPIAWDVSEPEADSYAAASAAVIDDSSLAESDADQDHDAAFMSEAAEESVHSEDSTSEFSRAWELAHSPDQENDAATVSETLETEPEALRSTEEILAAAGFFPNFVGDSSVETQEVKEDVTAGTSYQFEAPMETTHLAAADVARTIWTAKPAEVTEEDQKFFADTLPDWEGLAKMVAAEATKEPVLRISSEIGSTTGKALPAVETIPEPAPVFSLKPETLSDTRLFDSATIEQMIRQSVEEMMPQLVERIALNLGIAIKRDRSS